MEVRTFRPADKTIADILEERVEAVAESLSEMLIDE
jgi:hypothetical protein